MTGYTLEHVGCTSTAEKDYSSVAAIYITLVCPFSLEYDSYFKNVYMFNVFYDLKLSVGNIRM